MTARPSGIGSTNPTAPNCGIAIAARTSAARHRPRSARRAASSSSGRPCGSPRWWRAAPMRTVEVEDDRRVRRIEQHAPRRGPPVVGDGLVVGVGVLVVLRAARAGELDRRRGRRRAGRPGRRGGPARTAGARRRAASPAPRPRGRAARGAGAAAAPGSGAERNRAWTKANPAGRPGLGHDEPGRLGRLQRLEHGEQRRAVGGGEQVGVELRAERRRLVEHGAGLVVEELVAPVQPDRQRRRRGRRTSCG